MRRTVLRIVTAAATVLLALAGTASPAPGRAPDPDARGLTATPLVPGGRVIGVRASSSRLVRSDDALLARTGAEAVPVLLKLDHDPVASYAGGVTDLPATSPEVTGRSLTAEVAESSPYARALREREERVTSAIARAVPDARVVGALRLVYGGLVATVPADRARDLLGVPGVVAVQPDALRQPLPVDDPSGATSAEGTGAGGTGKVVATLDTGGQPVLDRYSSVPGVPDPDPDAVDDPTPERDAALAAASHRAAPGARTRGYRVCGALGCFTSDVAAATEAAILDGVDVLTLGLAGDEDPRVDALPLALLGAHAAGVVVVAPDGAGARTPWVVPAGPGGPIAAAGRAGAAAVVRGLHPDWSAAQVGSSLRATTGADDPGRPGLTFDETASRLAALGGAPAQALHLNTPGVDASLEGGPVTTRRTVTNVSADPVTYRVEVAAPEGASIAVEPRRFTVGRGVAKELTLTLTSNGLVGRQAGEVRLVAEDRPTLRLAVSVTGTRGEVTVDSECDATGVTVAGPTTCRVTATNRGPGATSVTGTTRVDAHLRVDAAGSPAAAAGAGVVALAPTTLAGRAGGSPRLTPSPSDRYVGLDALGITPVAVGDAEAVNVNLDRPFTFNGTSYDRIGVAADGYLLAGGADGPTDLVCCPGATEERPAGDVIAPFWTDLTGARAPGVLLATVTHGARSWVVVEWQLDAVDSGDRKVFQVWLGLGPEQDVTLAYPSDDLPDRQGLTGGLAVGALTGDGDRAATELRGDRAPSVPAGGTSADLMVLAAEPSAASSVTYTVEVLGYAGGAGAVRTAVRAAGAPEAATDVATVAVTGPAPGEVEAAVDRLAERVLGDAAAPDRRAGWAERLRTGTLTREGLARELTRDPAWLGRVVDTHYRTVTGSPPDARGRAFWVAELATGTPEHRLVAQLVASDDFWSAVDQDPGTFVERAFRVAVGRPPEPAGQAYWIDRLSEGLPRAEMAAAIASQDEVQQRRVTDLARLLLDRDPTAAEQRAWAAELRTGSLVDVAAQVLLA